MSFVLLQIKLRLEGKNERFIYILYNNSFFTFGICFWVFFKIILLERGIVPVRVVLNQKGLFFLFKICLLPYKITVKQSIVTSVNTITLEKNILKVNLTKDVWNSTKITNTQNMLLKTLAIQFSSILLTTIDIKIPASSCKESRDPSASV